MFCYRHYGEALVLPSKVQGGDCHLTPGIFFRRCILFLGYAQVAMVGNMRRSPLSNQLFEVIVCCPTAKMNTKENI